MSRSEGEMTLDLIGGMCVTLDSLPLDETLSAVVRHQTLAPILEPTAYVRGGQQNLDDQERMLRAAISLRDSARRVTERAS